MSEHNKTLARRFVQMFNDGDTSHADELISDEFVLHTSQMEPARGKAGLAEMITGLRESFPDGHYTVDYEVGDEDGVAHRWTFRGTHEAEFAGVPATGRQVAITGTAISRFRDGRIAEHMADWDAMSLMKQIGAIPS